MTAEIVQLLNYQHMTPDEFKIAIKDAGFASHIEFAKYIAAGPRTVADWADPDHPTRRSPGPPGQIVRLLENLKILREIRATESIEITRAPINATSKDAVTALSSTVSSMMGVAKLQGWNPVMTAEALEKLAQLYRQAAEHNNAVIDSLNAKSA